MQVLLDEFKISPAELRLLRAYWKMTTAELAAFCGVSRATVSAWENEKSSIPNVMQRFLWLEAKNREKDAQT